MAEATVPVDLFNPGQVFACLGFVEAAQTLSGEAEGVFDWREDVPVFRIRTPGDRNPVERVLAFLAEARVVAELPFESTCNDSWIKSWGPRVELPEGAPYPFPDPDSPAIVRAALIHDGDRLVLDHWGDNERETVKFWAGAGGYPGAALARDALELMRAGCRTAASDPFGLSVAQSSSFRLDWRRDYIPIDAGFSLNAHSDFKPMGFPLVELLAAIGLTHARPIARAKLSYRYGVVGRDGTSPRLWLPLSMLRAGLGSTALPFPARRFAMLLGWAGKEGQARAITTVTEENLHD